MTLLKKPLHDEVHPLLDKYNAWVLENESFARRLENVLYVVPMLVPAAVGNPDVVSEVGYSMGGLLKLYHDWVLYQVDPLSKEKTSSNSSLSVVQAARVPLSIISQVQVAAEMIALKSGGKQSRWNVIVLLELCKSVCKLVLLAHSKGQVLYKCGPYISCEVRPQDGEEYTGQRSGRVYRSSRPRESNQQPPTLSFLEPTYASGNEGAVQTAAEVLHIIRPVVYAVLCQRQSDRSWVPFLASFSTEIAGILLSTSVEGKHKRVPNDKVDEEHHRRKMCLFLYLLRNPVFSSVTEPVVEGVCNSTQPIPLLGRLVRFAVDNGLHYYQRRHFYTSAS